MAVDNIARGMAASALKNQGGGGSSLPIVNTATVGQTIKVAAVDGDGKPTEWEAVEFPAGGEAEKTWDRFFVELTDDETEYTYYKFGGEDEKTYDEFIVGIYIKKDSAVGSIRVESFNRNPKFVQINSLTAGRDLNLFIKGRIFSEFGFCDSYAGVSFNTEGVLVGTANNLTYYGAYIPGMSLYGNSPWVKPKGFSVGIGPLKSGSKIYVYAR